MRKRRGGIFNALVIPRPRMIDQGPIASRHPMQKGLALMESPAVFRRDAEGPGEGPGGKPGDMRRQHHIGQAKQRVGGVQRLGREYIQPRRGQMARLQCRDKR